MTAPTPSAPEPNAGADDPVDRERQVRRAVIASAVGTAIEWYDFFLYGVAAALVFPAVFFPKADPYTGTLLAFSTYFVGFVARPVGAALFGHWGDRIGRKASLIATLLLMGLATVAIGLVPGYDRIGVLGPILLTICRVLQGIGVGGEWGGSVLLAAEWGQRSRRGFLASWPQFGAPAGLLLANGALGAMDVVSGDAFLTWGWRVPFLGSIVLVGVGFWIRTGILETPVFSRLRAAGRIERAPVVQVLRRHWREVVLTALLRTGQQTPFYIFTAYVLSYGTQTLGLDRGTLLGNVLAAAAVSMVAIPLLGHLSDRVGRRRLVLIGAMLMIPWGFVYFELLDTRSPALVLAAILIAQPLHDLQYAPQAAVIADAFPPALRYSGASLGYQLASITAGGPAPLVALWLYERYQTSVAVGAYVAVTGVVTVVSTLLLRDTTLEEDE